MANQLLRMKCRLLIICLVTALINASASAQIDLTTGITGNVTGVGQSFNESRGIDVTVLSSSPIYINSMILHGFNVGGDLMAKVGARVYDSNTHGLIYSHDTIVYNIFYGTISMPVSYILNPGKTYRIGFYCSGTNSDNSAYMFQPTSFPYTEMTNHFQINHAYSIYNDTFPINSNIFDPLLSLGFDTTSVGTYISTNLISNKTNLYPNPNNGNFTFSYNSTSSTATLLITDLLGREVYRISINAESSEALLSTNLRKGVYFWKVSSEFGIESEGKLLIIN